MAISVISFNPNVTIPPSLAPEFQVVSTASGAVSRQRTTIRD